MRRMLLLVSLGLTGCVDAFDWSSQSPSADLDSMIWLEGGTFTMGYPELPPGPYGNHWKENQQPAHEVTLSGFYMDQTEVTIESYVSFLNDLYQVRPTVAQAHFHPLQQISFDGLFYVEESALQHPVHSVTWFDAVTFCGWAGKRLPTESEWERAAKGLENPTQAFPWTDGGANCDKAVYFTNRTLCEEAPREVGSRSPLGDTPEGLQDMAGNVAEWVHDRHGPYPGEPQTNPTGVAEGAYRVLRGGGFRETSDALRTMDRVPANPASRSEGVGFRCAVSE